MQVRHIFPRLAVAAILAGLTACGTADNPYEKLRGAPLVQGRLHAITLVSDSDAVAAQIRDAGYIEVTLRPNYSNANAVEAAIWGVPEPVAERARHFKSSKAEMPDLRLLIMPLAARGREAAAEVDEAFFRNVLGTGVPEWPLPTPPSDEVRLQVRTYLVSDVVAANRRLREAHIPVIYDPVGLTTSYLGDHRTLALRAPDGTVVQLVQTTAQ